MKYFLSLFILALFLFSFKTAQATNNYSVDLEKDSSQYLSITNLSQTGLNLTGDFTIEFWTKPEEALSLGTRAYIKKYGLAGNKGYLLRYLTTNVWRFTYSPDGNTVYSIDVSDTNYTNGEWAYYTFTFDASSGKFEVFRNSASIGSNTAAGTAIYDNTADVFLFDASGPYDGLIDEYIVWNDIRTQGEIDDSYNSGNGNVYVGNESNMIAYWRYENDFLDKTSNNNDLTNNNSAIFNNDVPFVDLGPAVPKFSFINNLPYTNYLNFISAISHDYATTTISSTTPWTEQRKTVYYIPFLFWFIVAIPLFFIMERIILELIIRFRKK